MQFRTIQETAILLYIGLTTFDSQTGTDSGILEVRIHYLYILVLPLLIVIRQALIYKF